MNIPINPDNNPSTLRKVYKLIVAFSFICTSITGFAEDSYTVSGYVTDKNSGESMIAVNVYIKELVKGTITNVYGFYSITVPAGKYTLVASYIGYSDFEVELNHNVNTRINIELVQSSILTEEVVITGERTDKNVESTELGKVDLPTEQVKAIPALFGEIDILKTLQLLPGVLSAGEGNSGFYVRGGGPDQNLVLLDHAVVYNPGHLFGFFSVFNADAIKNTTLIKGGMPASYGGRISSVVDVQMKEGNMREYEFEGGIGAISSRLTIQGPIKRDKSSFIVSARRTYLEVFNPLIRRLSDGDSQGNQYFFFDINAKINYKFSDKDRIFLSGYFGRDVFNFTDPDGIFNAKIPWGNATATLRYNHLFSDKMFMNAIYIYNDYKFEIESKFQDVKFSLFSRVQDNGLKLNFDYFPNTNHSMKYGLDYTYHGFTPYNATGSASDEDFGTKNDQSTKYAHQSALYFEDDMILNSRFKMNAGLRLSMFNHVGPLDKVVLDDRQNIIDTIIYKPQKNIATYFGVEPRISVRFKINETSSLKAGFTVNRQYIHLVTSSTTTLPTDLWVPSTEKVKPQLGLQYSLGYFKNFKKDMFETSIELYYKDLRNQIEYGESAVLQLNVDIEEFFVFGKARSYGAEFFIKKAKGKFNGWIGYTIAYTWRYFDQLNDGGKFPATYDRRHDLSVVAIYDISKKWRVSATFVYGTGQATTVPIGRYFIEGEIINQYGPRNSYRMAPYHRLDLGATLIFVKRKHYNDLTFSIYNVYNRMNPYFIFYDVSGNVESGDIEVQAKQASLFPILPSITWNFKFKVWKK